MADFIPIQSPLTEARDFPLEAEDLGLSQINPVPQQHSPYFNIDQDYGLSSTLNKKQYVIQSNDSASTREGLAASKNTSTTETRNEFHNLHHAIDAALKRSMVMYQRSPSTQTLTPTKPAITSSVTQTLSPVPSSYISYSTRNSGLNPYSKPNFFDTNNPYSKPVTLATTVTTTSYQPPSHQKVKSATATDLTNFVQSYRLQSARPTNEFTLEKTTVHHVEDLKSHKPAGFSSSASNFYPSSNQNTASIPIGYDKAKLDQILSKIATSHQLSPPPKNTLYTSNINFNHFPSNTTTVRHWDLPNQRNENVTRSGYIRESTYQNSINPDLLVQSPLEQRFGSPLTQQMQQTRAAPIRQNKNSSYVGEVQNDDDSQIPDDSVFEERIQEPVVVQTKPQVQPKIQKFIEEPEKPKKLTKRQEILNEKRNSKQTVRRHEEQSASKANSRYQSPDVRRSANKFELNTSTGNLLVSPSKVSATHTKNFGNQRANGGSDISSKFNYIK